MDDVNRRRELRCLRKEVKSLRYKLYFMIGVCTVLAICCLIGAYQIHMMTSLILSL